MANLKPKELPEEIRKDPFRQSEIIFFDLAKKLPDHWFVLYGVTWYLRVRNDSWSEGEADFVIISPETGLVIVEIKGGRIGRDEDGWYTIDRNDVKHWIKNPAEQAARCKHNLIRYIKQHEEYTNRDIPARHMVCFPNVAEIDAPSLIEIPREMQILFEDLENLEKSIINFTQRNYDDIGSTNIRLTPHECSSIANILKPDFECPNRWSTAARKQNMIMDQLTEEQAYIWEMMDQVKRISISGPAGSGKTILALKLIRNIIDDGGKVLALLPSIALKNYYSSLINNSNLLVYSYKDFDDNIDNTKYNLIVIDEAQDLTENDWLKIYLKFQIYNADRFLCVFDANQKLNAMGDFCPLETLVPVKLTKVLRNTKQIGSFTSNFYSGNSVISIVGPVGTKVQFTECNDETSIYHLIVDLVKHYVFEEGFEYSDIVVLFANNHKRPLKLESKDNSNEIGISFRSCFGYSEGTVYKSPIILTEGVYRFRGLESKIVILTGLTGIKEEIVDNAVYIGASRARNILHIISEKDVIKRLKKFK